MRGEDAEGNGGEREEGGDDEGGRRQAEEEKDGMGKLLEPFSSGENPFPKLNFSAESLI